MIELTLHPTAKPATYEARRGGNILVTSRQPFYEGARRLLAQGVPPDTPLTARWSGSSIVAMRSTVGEAAKWTVTEADRGGLRRIPWTPFTMTHSSCQGVGKDALEADRATQGPPSV